MISGNSSIRVTKKPFGAKSAIFTKLWVRHLWQALSAFKFDKHIQNLSINIYEIYFSIDSLLKLSFVV
jgi:hypothetical protein